MASSQGVDVLNLSLWIRWHISLQRHME
jgi:hypothetical protein